MKKNVTFDMQSGRRGHADAIVLMVYTFSLDSFFFIVSDCIGLETVLCMTTHIGCVHKLRLST